MFQVSIGKFFALLFSALDITSYREPNCIMKRFEKLTFKNCIDRGFTTNLVRTIPATMLTFSTYELAKKFGESRLPNRKE